MINAPCYECPDRVPGKCHSTCPKYKEFRAAVDAANERRHQLKAGGANNLLADGMVKKKKNANMKGKIKW